MKKALMLAPMGSVHRRFNKANIEALQRLGYKVDLAANFENAEGPEVHNQSFVRECNMTGIETYSIPFKRHSLIGSIKCLSHVKHLLNAERYNIVHAHTETGGLILRLSDSVKENSRFFYTPHGMSFWKGSSVKSQVLYRPLERWICGGMDMNLAMNQEEFSVLGEWNKDTAAYIHGIGLDLERFNMMSRQRCEIRKEFKILNNELLIVSVGELDDNKNHILAIEALAQLNRKDFKYVICGVGPKKDYLLRRSVELGLERNVILAGYRSDIPDILKSADLFVFPSFHEGLPVAVLEAMASGLPVLCSEIRGCVDVIKEGENGHLFNPYSIESISHQLKKMFSELSYWSHYSEMNMSEVQKYSYSVVVGELMQLYK